MRLPGEDTMRRERAALIAVLDTLPDEDFDHGRTLCARWAPRDVLAHLMGIEADAGEYAKAVGLVNRANNRIVAKMRGLSRRELMARAHRWATHPSLRARLTAGFLNGDLCVHHQDVLRGLGRQRQVPGDAAAAILREGIVLGGRRLLTHRVEPDDGGRAMGRGRVVRGSSEALGMWLCGRDVVTGELAFTPPLR